MKTELEFVTNKTWTNYARSLERRNRANFGESLSAVEIAKRTGATAIVMNFNDGAIVKVGWREDMRDAARVTPPFGLLL